MQQAALDAYDRADTPLSRALMAALSAAEPARLREALEYAVFPGGARIRPAVCLAVAEACRPSRPPSTLAYAAAAAVELLHCASLAHDDLPCFDDAALRRGRPSVHRAFGEATAVLVGDALIVAAFASLASASAPAAAIAVLAKAAGACGGLVSGQAFELEPEGGADVTRYHEAKTGALFEAAARLGALASGADAARFAPFGRSLGRFYQVADDVADRYATASLLGKPVGQDAANGRPTAIAGLRSREAAASILLAARADVVTRLPLGGEGDRLRAFAEPALDALVKRSLCATDGT